MVRIEMLMRSIRRESRLTQYYALGLFLLIFIASTWRLLHAGTDTWDDTQSCLFMMLLAFLALAYSRLTTRILQVAEALAALHDPAASSRPQGD